MLKMPAEQLQVTKSHTIKHSYLFNQTLKRESCRYVCFFTAILKGPRSKILAQSAPPLLFPDSPAANQFFRKIKPIFPQVFSLVTPAGVAAGIAASTSSSSSSSSSNGAGLAAVGLLQGEGYTSYVQCGGKGGEAISLKVQVATGEGRRGESVPAGLCGEGK